MSESFDRIRHTYVERLRNLSGEALMISEGAFPLSAKVVAARGVVSTRGFGDGSCLPSPEMLDSCEEAGIFVATEIVSGSKFVIVGDYDADGATSCAVLVRWLLSAGATVDFMVPSRFSDGYGMSVEVARRVVAEFSPDVVITVDNGMSSFEAVEYLSEMSIKVIVTDHHLPHAKGDPPAKFVLNPNRHPGHALSSLAGVAVAWLLCVSSKNALDKLGRESENPFSLLPFVSLGTVADVVPMSECNRDLVSLGLSMIRSGESFPALGALCAISKIDISGLTTADMGFMIAPRLNAAGRMGDMSDGIRCLLSDDDVEATLLSSKLDAMNKERRLVENSLVATALDDFKDASPSSRGLVVVGMGFHEGVIGLVASRLKERFSRPTIVLSVLPDGSAKGSCRSIQGFHMRDALEEVSRLEPCVFVKFGGHAMAAGLTLRPGAVEIFKSAFERVSESRVTDEMLSGVVMHDGDVPVDWLTAEMVWELEGLPFGNGFPPPVFVSWFDVVSTARIKSRHLKMSLSKSGTRFDAIMFNFCGELSQKALLSYSVGIDSWSGDVRLVVRDIVVGGIDGETD